MNSSEADGILLPYFNSDSSTVSFHSPFLHLTVGLAAVVDKASLVAHAVAVDDHAAVQVQTVVAAVGEVLLHHATPKHKRKINNNTNKYNSINTHHFIKVKVLCLFYIYIN